MASYSGFWNETGDQKDYGLKVDRNPINRRLMKTLRRKSTRVSRAVLDSIDTSLSVDEVTYTRVRAVPAEDSQGNSVVHGNAREVETITLRDAGNVTQSEIDDVHTYTRYDAQPSPYPTDIGGNGGGGKSTSTAPTLGKPA